MRRSYQLGDFVYLTTDQEQHKRLICEIRYDFNGITYVVSCGLDTSMHFEQEMSSEKTVII
jgi:hypothetical protein